MRQCQEIPGQQLFTYFDDDGTPRDIDSADVNEYIRAAASDEFSAKDFRTWVATVSCAMLLVGAECEAAGERKVRLNAAIEAVAARLGNSRTVCRKCYVHPEITRVYVEEGTLGAAPRGRRSRSLLPEERFVVRLLERRAREGTSNRTVRKLRESLRSLQRAA